MADDEVVAAVGAGDEAAPDTQAQFRQIISSLWKLKEFKASSKETVDSVTRKMRREKDGYLFKKKGHRLQYEFNKDIASKMEETENALRKLPVTEATKQTLDTAKELLKQGMSLLARRQKHIKIADRSDQ
uniref:Uncharacterized protein n=1 Tax=Amphimedon queenslandica TaxID=400682 RepID=A0A1X7VSN7_AMPQE